MSHALTQQVNGSPSSDLQRQQYYSNGRMNNQAETDPAQGIQQYYTESEIDQMPQHHSNNNTNNDSSFQTEWQQIDPDEQPQDESEEADVGLVQDEWEVRYNDLKVESIIGTGSFGQGNQISRIPFDAL